MCLSVDNFMTIIWGLGLFKDVITVSYTHDMYTNEFIICLLEMLCDK